MIFGQKVLHARLRYPEWPPFAGEWGELDLAQQLPQAVRTFNRLIGPGHAFRREQRRKHTVASSIARGTPFPHRKIVPTRRVQSEIRRDGKRNGVADLTAIEFKHFGGACRTGYCGVEN